MPLVSPFRDRVGFSAIQTIQPKQNFAEMCLELGFILQKYLAENGVFKASSFIKHDKKHQQAPTSTKIFCVSEIVYLNALFKQYQK